jgi:hypothetical protein
MAIPEVMWFYASLIVENLDRESLFNIFLIMTGLILILYGLKARRKY